MRMKKRERLELVFELEENERCMTVVTTK